MIANYHTHTERCRHAWGAETEYVEQAIDRGLKIFGFSDHAPQWFPGDYYSRMRMFPGQLAEYCDTVRALQDQYKGTLQIPLGLEAEYYPAVFADLVSQVRDHGVDYMILGQHWIGNEENEPYCGAPTKDEKILQQYCTQVIRAMETGVFTYLAHPDLIHYIGSKKVYARHIRELCRSAKDTQTPLEINFLGIREERHYPNEIFWQIAAEEGCPVVLGIDAHAPGQVSDTEAQKQALAMVQKLGLTLLETVPLKKI